MQAGGELRFAKCRLNLVPWQFTRERSIVKVAEPTRAAEL